MDGPGRALGSSRRDTASSVTPEGLKLQEGQAEVDLDGSVIDYMISSDSLIANIKCL